MLVSCSFQKDSEVSNYPIVRIQDSNFFNGISYVAPVVSLNQNSLIDAVNINSNSVCFMPFAYTKDNSPNLKNNSFWQWYGEKPEGIINCIDIAQKMNMKIMIKPQIWIGNGSFTGEFKLMDDNDWSLFEKNYLDYILIYAKICNDKKVDILCIGTELKCFVNNRVEFWNSLIDSVRKIYSGKLIYAANWDESLKVPFWNKLDFIGIDAYYPLSKSKTPEVNELMNNWVQYETKIDSLSTKFNKKIIFTEYGYRSMDNNCDKPWQIEQSPNANNFAQENAYLAIYKTFWKKYFAGGFIWKWYDNLEQSDLDIKTDFTPQNKSVINTIKSFYKN